MYVCACVYMCMYVCMYVCVCVCARARAYVVMVKVDVNGGVVVGGGYV